ncbi:STAS domain-containing protein [Actinomadura rudentiformis]|uniref:Anti-sigma factor antagonist n=1 Tax=Actinomadura rudentiformis TaxID=359158 RepID=A0A6H9YGF6_9ACTN|nr:STAS domain-containing protein [Actinomadura rudentiformis]KAB2345272.1 STAS domain-containing protein [Actinomadura rudentiformis]
MQQLQVTAEPQDGLTVVRLRGELDIANADDLRQTLRSARREHGDLVILDLEGLEFMDSHGLSVIISCHKAATEAGGSVSLAAPRPIVRRTLEVTGLASRLAIFDSMEEAVAVRIAERAMGGEPATEPA